MDESGEEGAPRSRRTLPANTMSFSGASRKGERRSRANTQQTGQDLSDTEVKRSNSQFNQLYSVSLTNLDLS